MGGENTEDVSGSCSCKDDCGGAVCRGSGGGANNEAMGEGNGADGSIGVDVATMEEDMLGGSVGNDIEGGGNTNVVRGAAGAVLANMDGEANTGFAAL